jgi:ribosomal-protein-alanine N-acetyltransferase
MQKKTELKSLLTIKKARTNDIDSVFKIESEQFPYPWKKSLLHAELSNSISSFYLTRLPESDEVIGYIIFWLLGDTLEIHKIAVKEEFKRKGVGSMMINFTQKIALDRDIKKMFLEVRESNKTAAHFYDQLGFKKMTCRKNYYQNPPEDAIIYIKSI